jgi:hypothetical protein
MRPDPISTESGESKMAWFRALPDDAARRYDAGREIVFRILMFENL